MISLSGQIEIYLKKMLEEAANGTIEIQRSALSQIFECVPSQINYVLGTRFTPENGFVVETRRGGGGYVRIIRIDLDTCTEVKNFISEKEESGLSYEDARRILQALEKNNLIDSRERILLDVVMSNDVLDSVSESSELRANIVRKILYVLLRDDF